MQKSYRVIAEMADGSLDISRRFWGIHAAEEHALNELTCNRDKYVEIEIVESGRRWKKANGSSDTFEYTHQYNGGSLQIDHHNGGSLRLEDQRPGGG